MNLLNNNYNHARKKVVRTSYSFLGSILVKHWFLITQHSFLYFNNSIDLICKLDYYVYNGAYSRFFSSLPPPTCIKVNISQIMIMITSIKISFRTEMGDVTSRTVFFGNQLTITHNLTHNQQLFPLEYDYD